MKLRQLQGLPSLVTGKKVVLANGCFDILHVGHLRYLEHARALGDVLVVAINSDESMHRIKDPGRPILDENERVSLISALRCVDHVVLFDEPDVSLVLEILRPAIHAKGTDYTEQTVPERDKVLAYGGEVRIAGDPKSHSTRDIIEQILEKTQGGHGPAGGPTLKTRR
jgi:rfaE bifunctional protein nucleotidyltransferase chain/domain